MSELQFEGKYIEFHWAGYSKTGVTETWRVMTKGSLSVLLGTIKWFGSWRCYSFFVSSAEGEFELVFEKQCLRDIANFCEKVTVMQREKRLGMKKNSAKEATKQ
jgi:hypothetical protein